MEEVDHVKDPTVNSMKETLAYLYDSQAVDDSFLPVFAFPE
jgi:hypothetical protein